MILIDTTFLHFGKTGIGTVINQILSILSNEKIEYKQISFYDFYQEKTFFNWYFYFNKILFTEANKLNNDDIFLFPENLGGILRTVNLKCKTVFIVYDLFELHSKNSFIYMIKKKRFSHVLNGVKKIITISNICKNEIGIVFPKFQEKLFVLYPFYIEEENGEKKEFNDMVRFSKERIELLNNKYILANGSGQERKNAEFLIKNAERIYNDFGLRLFLFGKDFYNNGYKNINDLIMHYEVRDYVIHIGALNDAELNYVYKHAECFVFPSIAEGFGLPPVEALMCNCRIAVSHIDIFKEVLAPLDRFFDFSYESLAINLKKVLAMSNKDFIQEKNSIIKKFEYKNYRDNLLSILTIKRK